MGAFIELDNNDLMSIDGGDTTAAIIVGVAAIGVVVLTALCPPAGAATAKVVGACLWKALMALLLLVEHIFYKEDLYL